jgi:hypothetical protein
MTFMKKARRVPALAALGLAALLPACSNFPSRKPPLYVWDDMKWQEKYKPQMSSSFFADGRASRSLVLGTIARETYFADTSYDSGVADNNTYVARNPLPLTRETLERGQQRFNIYCAPCHDRTGSGRGIVPAKSAWLPANLHDERIVKMVDGEIFHVVTYGRRTMPGYQVQVPASDRWAIVAYVRALQRSWLGTLADVPADLQGKLR